VRLSPGVLGNFPMMNFLPRGNQGHLCRTVREFPFNA
jgi:hypothetical protein